jgi:hypothetical protein
VSGAEPVIRVVRGDPDPDELAALVVVITRMLTAQGGDPPTSRAVRWWRDHHFADGWAIGPGRAWRTGTS